ncbi:hypothetical protein [Bacteriovorax sp. Seq25_V]|uniref:hypothetical protein n=1 Tax=Bacteriovorax sp. Seq25_V TaxID=1201288 RepID=UPI000554EE76|nr:hypothetical protein [Bacteriovorax sp. Seq25_V]
MAIRLNDLKSPRKPLAEESLLDIILKRKEERFKRRQGGRFKKKSVRPWAKKDETALFEDRQSSVMMPFTKDNQDFDEEKLLRKIIVRAKSLFHGLDLTDL